MSFVKGPPLSEKDYAPFAQIHQAFGFVPNFFRAQTCRTDLIEAQLCLLGFIVEPSALDRRHKEYIFLAVSARNLSTYCVTAHCEIVRMLGLSGPGPEQIALNHNVAAIAMSEKALLNFAVKLNNTPLKVESCDIDALRTFGFSDAQILEAIAMTALAQYSNTVAFAIGAVPDFENSQVDFAAPQAGRLPGR